MTLTIELEMMETPKKKKLNLLIDFLLKKNQLNSLLIMLLKISKYLKQIVIG